MKMYEDYFLERQPNGEFFHDEDGFYGVVMNGVECFIAEFHVAKEKRRSKIGTHMFNAICDVARSRGCKRVTANVSVNAKNSTESLSACIAVGMKVIPGSANVICLEKEI